MSASNLQIQGLCKRYGEVVALAPTDLEVAQGEFLTLLGPSGSGKTTLLSLIAGLGRADAGRILIQGEDVTDGAPYERDIGMVFQNYALFPHMTVAENIAFPLRMRRVAARETGERVRQALEMVHLPQVGHRYPRELSGGQQQRIALARCMVYRPSIILMDEPLGALDKKLRDHMQLEIKRIHRELGTTIVYVTHDQEEAMTMSDRICLMNGGAIAQLGTPAELYFRPRNAFVADFLGESNLLDAEIIARDGERARVLVAGLGECGAMACDPALVPGSRVKLMVRPQSLRIHDARGASADDVLCMDATLSEVIVTGGMTRLHLQPLLGQATPLVAAFPTTPSSLADCRVGQALRVSWLAGDAVAIAA